MCDILYLQKIEYKLILEQKLTLKNYEAIFDSYEYFEMKKSIVSLKI